MMLRIATTLVVASVATVLVVTGAAEAQGVGAGFARGIEESRRRRAEEERHKLEMEILRLERERAALELERRRQYPDEPLARYSSPEDDDEVSLFDVDGRAIAYIAIDDELTIYLWGGKPVAYLDEDYDGYHVYGFNGNHLGWYVDGVIRDRRGDAACATRNRIRSPGIEPIKRIKQIKPIQHIPKIPPVQPIFSAGFGSTTCRILLGSGGV